MDRYSLPINGIPQPEYENPVNLFQRQLTLEELSFELSHEKYKNSLKSLIELGKASELASSHRYIVNWVNHLEAAILE